MSLYTDPETGRDISTHSMIRTFRYCPKQAEFKYAHRLKPKRGGAALKRGVWMHELLEIHHNGGDWRLRHKQLSSKFNEMFDEEKEYYGDLPTEIGLLMEAYVWHYANEPWTVHETEVTLEAEMPDGRLYRGKVDAIVENHQGLWLVDHKTHKSLPDLSFRLRDAQNSLYIWAAIKNKIPVQGFIWNYVKWRAPQAPEMVYKNTKNPRLSKKMPDCDYQTFTRAIKRYREEYPDFKITKEIVEHQRYLKSLRHDPENPVQGSPFFLRSTLDKNPELIRQVLREAFHTSARMHEYDFSSRDVERIPDRSCSFCDYKEICQVELLGGNTKHVLKNMYTVGDPQDYYQDRAGEPAVIS